MLGPTQPYSKIKVAPNLFVLLYHALGNSEGGSPLDEQLPDLARIHAIVISGCLVFRTCRCAGYGGR